jgi:imidazolonepropionase-like amidohydrolase
MMRIAPILGVAGLALTSIAASITAASAASADALVVHVEQLMTGTGTTLHNAHVVIENGRFTSVRAAGEVALPADARELTGWVATPGFIDAQTSAGLSGLRNVPSVLDQDERTDPDQSALRAIDAFDPRDPLLRFLLEHGVTIVQAGPGPANPIAGQAGIFRTSSSGTGSSSGDSADDRVVRFPSAMVFNLGEEPKATYEESRGRSTRMGTAALIRERLTAARAYGKRGGLFGGAPDEPDLGLEALGEVVRGSLPAIFTAHRADDILTALRIIREFELQAAIGSATEGYLVRPQLRAARVPVFLGPVMERVSLPETENASYENAALLTRARIKIAIRSGFEAYVPKNRVLLFEAAIAAVNGLGAEAALHAITLAPAEMLGIAADYGSVEVGKVADLVLFDGDPFEYTTHVTAVIAGGRIVHQR